MVAFLFPLQKKMQYGMCVRCIVLTWRQGTHYCLHLVQLCFIDVFELCTMTCLHVSSHFYSSFFFYSFLAVKF